MWPEPTGHPVWTGPDIIPLKSDQRGLFRDRSPQLPCVLWPYLGRQRWRGRGKAGPRRGAAATRGAGVLSAASTAAATASFGSSLGLPPRIGPVIPHHSSFSVVFGGFFCAKASASSARSGKPIRTHRGAVCPHSARRNPAQPQITELLAAEEGGCAPVRACVRACSCEREGGGQADFNCFLGNLFNEKAQRYFHSCDRCGHRGGLNLVISFHPPSAPPRTPFWIQTHRWSAAHVWSFILA